MEPQCCSLGLAEPGRPVLRGPPASPLPLEDLAPRSLLSRPGWPGLALGFAGEGPLCTGWTPGVVTALPVLGQAPRHPPALPVAKHRLDSPDPDTKANSAQRLQEPPGDSQWGACVEWTTPTPAQPRRGN